MLEQLEEEIGQGLLWIETNGRSFVMPKMMTCQLHTTHTIKGIEAALTLKRVTEHVLPKEIDSLFDKSVISGDKMYPATLFLLEKYTSIP